MKYRLIIKDRAFIKKPNCYQDIIECNNSVSFRDDKNKIQIQETVCVYEKNLSQHAQTTFASDCLIKSTQPLFATINNQVTSFKDKIDLKHQKFLQVDDTKYRINNPLNNTVLDSNQIIHFSLNPVVEGVANINPETGEEIIVPEKSIENIHPECYNILWISNISGLIGKGKKFDTYLMAGKHHIMIVLMDEMELYNGKIQNVNVIKDQIWIEVKDNNGVENE